MSNVFVENKILHYNKKNFDSENLSLEILSDNFHTLAIGENVENIDIEFLHATLSQKYVCCVKILPNFKITVASRNINFREYENSLVDYLGTLYFTPRLDSGIYKIPERVLDATDWGECVSKKNIKKIIFPSTISNLSYFDFSEFKNLESVEINENQDHYKIEGGWLFEKGKVLFISKKNGESIIPNSVKLNDDFFDRIKYETKTCRFRVHDDNAKYKSENNVIFDKKGNLVFINHDEKNLVIPEGVKKIDSKITHTVIQDLESISLPSTLGSSDFSIFSSINNIILSEKNKKLHLAGPVLYDRRGNLISICNFSGDTLTIPEGVRIVDDFYNRFNCNRSADLTEIVFPKTVFSGNWDYILSTAFLNGTKISFPSDAYFKIKTTLKKYEFKISSEYTELIETKNNTIVATAGSKSKNKLYSIIAKKEFVINNSGTKFSSAETLFIFSGIREATKFLKENRESLLINEYKKIHKESVNTGICSPDYSLKMWEAKIKNYFANLRHDINCSIKIDLFIKEIDVNDTQKNISSLTKPVMLKRIRHPKR